jgi:hypothetical protein
MKTAWKLLIAPIAAALLGGCASHRDPALAGPMVGAPPTSLEVTRLLVLSIGQAHFARSVAEEKPRSTGSERWRAPLIKPSSNCRNLACVYGENGSRSTYVSRCAGMGCLSTDRRGTPR